MVFQNEKIHSNINHLTSQSRTQIYKNTCHSLDFQSSIEIPLTISMEK